MNAATELALFRAGLTLESVGGVDYVGLGPAAEDIVQLDGFMQRLDEGIQSYEFVPDASTTPDHFAHMVAMTTSLRLRWGAFFPEWRAWRDAHEQSFSRLSGASAIEFGEFEVRYNAFRDELLAMGGTTSAPPANTDVPGPGESGVDKVLAFLDSVKWLAIVGLGAYILVGTGAVPALGAALGASRR